MKDDRERGKMGNVCKVRLMKHNSFAAHSPATQQEKTLDPHVRVTLAGKEKEPSAPLHS